MAVIDIVRITDDARLNREVWSFHVQIEFSGKLKFCLKRYMRQYRETRRHGWKGEKWDSMDERRYFSPTSIPADVLEEAVSKLAADPKFYIGWYNDESEYKPS